MPIPSRHPIRPHASLRLTTEKNGGATSRIRAKVACNITDAWEAELGVTYYRRKDWILWHYGNRMNGFDAEQLELQLDSNLLVGSSQELRLGIQWAGIDATGRSAYRIDPDGDLVESGEDASSRSFDWAQMTGQIRYKYEFSPLSDLFLVYTRGSLGYWDSTSKRDHLGDLLTESFERRDVELFLFKIRYRM